MADRAVRVRLSAENSAFIRGMRESGQAVNRLQRDISALDRELRRVNGRRVDVEARLDTSRYDAELRRLETQHTRLNVAIKGQFSERDLQRQLDRMTLHVRVRPVVDPIRRISQPGGDGGGGSGGGGFMRTIAVAALGLTSVLPQTIDLISQLGAASVALVGQIGAAGAAGAGLVPIFGAMGQAAGAFVLAGGDVALTLEAQTKAAKLAVEGGEAYDNALAKYQARLKALAPNQRAFVEQVGESHKALSALTEVAGERLFDGFGQSLARLTDRLLPVLRTNLNNTVDILNDLGNGLARDLAGPLRDDLGDAFALNNHLMLRAEPIVRNLSAAFLTVYNAAGPLAVRLADAGVQLSEWLRTSTQAQANSGGLSQFFEDAGDAAFSLGRTLGDLGDGLWDVLRISNDAGGGLLNLFEDLADRFNRWTDSVQGEQALTRWFESGQRGMASFIETIRLIRTEFAGITENVDLGGSFRDAIPEIAQFIKDLTEAGTAGASFGDAMVATLGALNDINAGGALLTVSTSLASLVTGLSNLLEILPPLGPVLSGVLTAMVGMKVVGSLIAPIVGFGRAMAGLGSASTTALALGGVTAILAVGATAWGTYSRAINSTQDALDGIYEALTHGTLSQLQDSRDALAKTLQGAQELERTVENRGFLSGLLHPIENVTKVANDASGAVKVLSQELAYTDSEIAQLDLRIRNYVDSTNTGAGATLSFDEALRLADAAGVKATDNYQTLVTKIKAYKAQNTSAAEETRNHARDLEILASKESTASEKADALRRAMQRLAGTALDVREANLSFREAVDAVSDSIEANGRGLSENTEQGRANQRVLIAAKKALEDKAVAATEGGATEKELAHLLRLGSAELRDQVEAAGKNKREIADMNRVMGLTPTQIETLISIVGRAAAERELEKLGASFKKLLPPELRPLAVSFLRQENAQAARAPRKASGGLLSGPGTGTSDSILGVDHRGQATAWVSNGEYVVNERSTRKHLPLIEAINADRLAGGGSVGQRVDYQFPPSRLDSAFSGPLMAAARKMAASASRMYEPSASANGRGGLGPRAAAARAAVMEMFGITNIGGYNYRNIAGTNVLSKHALGKAIDVMTNVYSARQNVARYFVANAGRYGVDNVIADRMIWNRPRGWHRYTGQNPHTDHTHIDFYAKGGLLNPHVRDNGGPLQPGYTFNGTGRQEFVVPPQWVQGSRLPAPAMAGGGATVQRHEHDVTVRHESEAEIAYRVGRQIETNLRDAIAVAGGMS